MPAITAFYAALLAVVLVWLSLRVIRLRRGIRVPIGAGGDRLLERAQRAQANFTEYVPLALLLIAFGEMLGAWPLVVHVLGLALFTGRIVHGIGIAREPEDFRFRVAGMQLTINTLIASALITGFLSLRAMTGL